MGDTGVSSELSPGLLHSRRASSHYSSEAVDLRGLSRLARLDSDLRNCSSDISLTFWDSQIA